MCECVCNQGHRIKGKCKNIYTKQTDECVREFARLCVCVCVRVYVVIKLV